MAKVNKDRLEDQIVDQLDGFDALSQKIDYLAEDIDAALLVNKIVYDTNEAIGDMTSLQTDEKDNLVNAVNSTNVKVNSLAQAPNEYEWLSAEGQLEYTLPNNSSYNPNLKWLEVVVGGAPIAPSLIERIPPNKFKLLLSPSDILEGLRVVARWVEPIIAGDGNGYGKLHHTSHEIGGNDELDLTKLKGYKENVADKLGDFNNLDTVSKTNLVSAINETVLKTKDNAETISENSDMIEKLSKSANEYEWISTAGQVVYILPSNTTYDPNTKWLEVKVGGAPIPLSKIRKDSPSQFTLLVDSSKIPAGVNVVARWTETYVPATSGHEATHLAGGTDEIDVTKLKGFKESVDDRIGTLQEKSKKTEAFVHVSQYGAVGDYYLSDGTVNPNPTDDTVAILNALAASKRVEFSNKAYLLTNRLVLREHVLRANSVGDSFYGKAKIVFKSMPAGLESCIHVATSSQVDNITFEHAKWDTSTPEINGLTVGRKLVANNCGFNAFPGHGIFLYGQPYNSLFNSCTADYNKKHNIVVGNGANALLFINTSARWAGTTVYKTAPTVAGNYDGYYFDGKFADVNYTQSDWEPTAVTLIGGDISYNSRYGVNFKYSISNTMIGGYAEFNLSGYDLAIDLSYGITVLNPMLARQTPLITTPRVDPNNSVRKLENYPNHITVRGKNYGDGTLNKFGKYQSAFIDKFIGDSIVFSSDFNNVIFDRSYNGTGVNQAFLKLTDYVHLNSKNATFGTTTPPSDKGIFFFPTFDGEGSEILRFINGTDFTTATSTIMKVVKGANGSSVNSAMRIAAHSGTVRSISAGGTVNTSGADYAEYMYKADNCGLLLKGDIVGIDVKGKLTDKWNDAISFIVKSTNPSFVGGDNWTANLPDEPTYPTQEEESDEQFQVLIEKYQKEKAKYDNLVEEERKKVDRVAFSGLCPVNVYNAKPGDFIIPVQDGENIKGQTITNPTFEQYQSAIGKVISVEDDGRARVIVKVV